VADDHGTQQRFQRINRNAGLISALVLLVVVLLGWLGSRLWSDVRDTQQHMTTVVETLGQLDKRISALRSEVQANAKAQQEKLGEVLTQESLRQLQMIRSGTPPAGSAPLATSKPSPAPQPPSTPEPKEPQL